MKIRRKLNQLAIEAKQHGSTCSSLDLDLKIGYDGRDVANDILKTLGWAIMRLSEKDWLLNKRIIKFNLIQG